MKEIENVDASRQIRIKRRRKESENEVVVYPMKAAFQESTKGKQDQSETERQAWKKGWGFQQTLCPVLEVWPVKAMSHMWPREKK